jgi:hypothetical protein
LLGCTACQQRTGHGENGKASHDFCIHFLIPLE